MKYLFVQLFYCKEVQCYKSKRWYLCTRSYIETLTDNIFSNMYIVGVGWFCYIRVYFQYSRHKHTYIRRKIGKIPFYTFLFDDRRKLIHLLHLFSIIRSLNFPIWYTTYVNFGYGYMWIKSMKFTVYLLSILWLFKIVFIWLK